jgi:hypothetical protein
MTKGELRKARKEAKTNGQPLVGELALDNQRDTTVFSESARGYRARERWARRYAELNGAPENDSDC